MKYLVPVLALALFTGLSQAPAASSHGASSRKATAAHAQPAPDPAHEEHAPTPGPALSTDSHWTASVLIVIAAMFVAAAVIGPIYRANLPQELPVTHSHDEPPGTSGHHGHGGTIDHGAPDGHHH